MLDVTRLAMLRELSLRGTIAAAAHAMGYTPSAISQQLATLEREAGVALTERSGRRLRLTPAGERLVRRAGTILGELEAAEVELRTSTDDVSGTVRVAVFQSAALTLIPATLQRLHATHPALTVLVRQSEPGSALADTWARDHDLVIAEEYPHHSAPHYPGVDRRPLVTDEIRLVVGEAHRHVRRLADAADAPWVMEPRGTATRHFTEEACRVAGFEPDVRFETPDLQAHARYISAGLAVGFLPGLMWEAAGLAGSTRALPGSPHRTVFTAARSASRGDPAIDAVRAALEHSAHAIAAEREAPRA